VHERALSPHHGNICECIGGGLSDWSPRREPGWMSSGQGKVQVNREGAVPDYYILIMGKFRIPEAQHFR